MGRRRGFTLVETLVAVVLIDVGLLALVTAGAVVVRQSSGTRLRARAVQAAHNRLEQLGAAPCQRASGVSVGAAAGVDESWSVDTLPNAVRQIRDSVTFSVLGAPRALVLGTRLSC
jgi:Tfp pilus assembly protein PilV